MLRSITYEIPLAPIPWQRAGINSQYRRFFDRQKQEKLAIGLYISSIHNDAPLFEGPLLLEATFYFPYPKTKSKKTPLPVWHWVKPDGDNLQKFLCDSITDTEVVWHDDKQVAWSNVKKLYGKIPRTIFTISELE